ncbi:MAG: serine/threonine protein kinase [Myxococcota bacterium]|jgi:serine/threonine protein kinase
MTQGRTYRVLEAVGKGGFGTVYRAEMLGPGGFSKPVALKVLNADVAEQDGIAERLRDEARLLGMLQHRSIVWVDGLLQLNGRWTVVMEFVEGVNLRQLLKAGPVPVGCALDIVQEVAGAFHYAYEMPSSNGRPLHLLHRDVKPSNIHVTPTGDVKVLDFGVARADFQTRESVTRSLFFGSLEYMSPERLDAIDTHAGDIYALGAVLYELIVGEKFGRSSGNRERHNTHLKARLGELWEVVQDRELYKLLADCLAYDDALRPAARLLERRVRKLRSRFGEPWLTEWAESVIPEIARTAVPFEDELSGSLLTEQPEQSQGFPPLPATPAPSAPDPAASSSFPHSRSFRDEPPQSGPHQSDSFAHPLPTATAEAAPRDRSKMLLAMSAGLVGAIGVLVVGLGVVGLVYVAFKSEPALEAQPVMEPVEMVEVVETLKAPLEEPPEVPPVIAPPEDPPPEVIEEAPEEVPEDAVEVEVEVEEPEWPGQPLEVEPDWPPPEQWPPEDAVKPIEEPEEPEEPIAEDEPEAPDVSAQGSVVVQGAVMDLKLEGASGTFRRGMLPAGSYQVKVTFDGTTWNDSGSVTVAAGQQVVLVCRSNLKRCIAR